MHYITTTELRTKSSELIELLKSGASVNLVHRSKVVGTIAPKEKEVKTFDSDKFLAIVKDLNLPVTTVKERKHIYYNHIMKKYGKGLPRHK